MLFEDRDLAGIADGTITLAFRRWRTPRAKEGSVHRTPAGRIRIGSVDAVAPREVTDAEARRSGSASAAELLRSLRGDAASRLYRIALELLDEPDPRAQLAASDDLTAGDVFDIGRRLDRMDARSTSGPWTRQVLALIGERPATRAATLAASQGRELVPFKRDVRKLKELGLTESLEIGYRLSPRGRAFLVTDPQAAAR